MVDIFPVSFEELANDDNISVEQRIFLRDLQGRGYLLIHNRICAYCGKPVTTEGHDSSKPKLGHI